MGHIIRGGVLSYPNLFTPKLPPNAKPGQKARYSCMLLIPHGTDLKELQMACYNLLREKWGDRTDDLLKAQPPAKLKWPFRTDNTKQDGSQRYDPEKFKCFITPWSESQPGLVDRYAGSDGKPVKILQPTQDKFYPGCVVNVSVRPFVYDQQGNRGVNLGLQNLQFWADGERLDNRVAAEDEFQAEARPEADLAAAEGGTNTASAGGTGSRGAALNDLFT